MLLFVGGEVLVWCTWGNHNPQCDANKQNLRLFLKTEKKHMDVILIWKKVPRRAVAGEREMKV